ncbi:unnamed protein product [Spirodela intermedia]|uniref:WRC domain-containing protein n=1 Tax=Spirodela intermedia TaxID=51605 RepID=A0A7I8ILK9_SPIIN|nr:unnamed protein product [Spirodela intermedia]CAA6658398.1 unnamed protein product [Spirodela intermedia]
MGAEGPVPGHLRCRRSDGKQWQCSRRAEDGKSFCEFHHLQALRRSPAGRARPCRSISGAGGATGSSGGVPEGPRMGCPSARSTISRPSAASPASPCRTPSSSPASGAAPIPRLRKMGSWAARTRR